MAQTHGTYPSVTRILAPWSDFSSVPPGVLENAANRGTRVHQACLCKVRGLWSMPESDVEPFLSSFLRWLPSVEVIDAEFELTDSALGLVGHPDLLVKFRGDSSLSIVDLKTPTQYNPIWRPQLAAYKYLAEHNGRVISRICSLRLSRQGRPPILNESTGTYGHDLAGFMSALDAWKYFTRLKERKI